MRTCATCNASHQNTVERVLRCMGCVAKPNGNSNWSDWTGKRWPRNAQRSSARRGALFNPRPNGD